MSACPENLLYRHRCLPLAAEDETLLQAHLQSCALCAAEAGIATAFESVGRARPGDEALVANAVAGAMRPKVRRPLRTSPWMLAAAAGVALVIVAGLAAAGWGLYRRTQRPSRLDGPASAPALAPPVSTAPAMPHEPEPLPSVEPELTRPAKVVPSVSSTAPAERPRSLRARPAAPAAESPPSLPDLKALFAAANEARRSGHITQASDLYTDVQRLFPESREARLSFVSFGRMLLDNGQMPKALQQFERYLAVAPGDVLAAEAFYGRARALMALHREAEAQKAWSDLLARFPDSIYADVARRQLHKVPSTTP